MSRRVVVAGRQGKRPRNGRVSPPKDRSKRSILTGIVIPLVAIIAAFFTTPAYDLWKEFVISQSSALKVSAKSSSFGRHYVFQQSIPTPEMNTLFDLWQSTGQASEVFTNAGGVPVFNGVSSHRVDLVGNRSENIQIKDIRVHVLNRKPLPKEGTHLYISHDAAREIEKSKVNLSDPDKALRSADSGLPLLDEKTIYLSKGEPIGIGIDAFSPNGWYEWELEIEVSYGDKVETITSRSDGTPGGPPFQTISNPSSVGNFNPEFSQEYIASNSFLPLTVINCSDVRRGIQSEVDRARKVLPSNPGFCFV